MFKKVIVCLVLGLAAACSDDTQTPIIDAGAADTSTTDTASDTSVDDAGADATQDVSVTPDAGQDMAQPDADPVDMTTPDMDAPDMEPPPIDPLQVCLADCNYAGPRWCEVDCDYDGLSNCEEVQQLGTNACDNDTDSDGLSDLDELQAGTDPLLTDSDADGLSDYLETVFGFNPTNPSTLNDNILDGDRWIVSACDNPEGEPIDYYTSPSGDWIIGLPPAFSNHVELTIATATSANKYAGSVFDDPANEVTALLFSRAPAAGQQNAQDVLASLRSRVAQVGTINQDNTGADFPTHDYFTAAVSKFLIQTSTQQSARAVRDNLLLKLSGVASADITGLPVAAGNTYNRFRVFISVTYRKDAVNGDRILIAAAVAPADKYDTREKVKFRMDDLTNTTNVSRAQDTTRARCNAFRAGEGNPEADFYWVLDQSGSMFDDYVRVKNVANLFFNELENTALDYRIGVTNMDEQIDGRLRSPPGWHTDRVTFINEIDVYVEDCVGCGPTAGGSEWGLSSAQEGIQWMRSSAAPQVVRIRPDAQLITIFMSDEEDQTIQNSPLSTSAGQQALAGFKQFFEANTIAFSIVGTSSFPSSDGEAYRQVAIASGGGFADLLAQDISETIQDIIYAATGLASNYQLPEVPISSTLRVYKNAEWVPRSRENGFDYFASTNSIAFFGSYRPEPADPTMGRYGDDVSVSYSTFLNRTKNP
ncbi:MAG: hypothetical protein R3E66_20830 [bacterium]